MTDTSRAEPSALWHRVGCGDCIWCIWDNLVSVCTYCHWGRGWLMHTGEKTGFRSSTWEMHRCDLFSLWSHSPSLSSESASANVLLLSADCFTLLHLIVVPVKMWQQWPKLRFHIVDQLCGCVSTHRTNSHTDSSNVTTDIIMSCETAFHFQLSLWYLQQLRVGLQRQSKSFKSPEFPRCSSESKIIWNTLDPRGGNQLLLL